MTTMRQDWAMTIRRGACASTVVIGALAALASVASAQQLVRVVVATERERDIELFDQLADQQRAQPQTAVLLIDHPVGRPRSRIRAPFHLDCAGNVSNAAADLPVHERHSHVQRAGSVDGVPRRAELPP
jgi:hypothetical protein